jgi:23S rRNA (uracil1939-C5)-methyltransferase
MKYAVRKNKEPVIIETFAIANRRIQTAMTKFRDAIDEEKMGAIRRNLTSISFSSPWRDKIDRYSCDEGMGCLLTLHYNAPIADECTWRKLALELCGDVSFKQITGRSRKQVFRALNDGKTTVNDTIWMEFQDYQWNVACFEPATISRGSIVRKVVYEKPEGSFCHPNARVMCCALTWILNRIALIRNCSGTRGRLLEMYCGFGAHTMALLQSDLLETIVAIECDTRLVKFLRINYMLNKQINSMTDLRIFTADAGRWAKNSQNILYQEFDILLVDPPRQGLDKNVCEMACRGSFQDFLYISCGREALVRDLALLGNEYDVVDCLLLDLFPQTDSVESLVHLRRRKRQIF